LPISTNWLEYACTINSFINIELQMFDGTLNEEL